MIKPVMILPVALGSQCDECKHRFKCCTSTHMRTNAYDFSITYDDDFNGSKITASFDISNMPCLEDMTGEKIKLNSNFWAEDGKIHVEKFTAYQEKEKIEIKISGLVFRGLGT